jgi:hypothetical protein
VLPDGECGEEAAGSYYLSSGPAPAFRAWQFAGRACAGACAPGAALPLSYRKARQHLAAHIYAIGWSTTPAAAGRYGRTSC